MCDLDLWLSAGVLWGMSHNYTVINYFLIIKLVWKNHLVFAYLYGFIPYSFTPAIILLVILYLINAYTLDGQHKEPQQQQQQGQQWREQPECQSTATRSAYSWASAGYASTNASDYVADHGQHAGCSTSSAAIAAEG
jgi:hypothetical protein